jgi:nucleoside-diphosphate-sugar epimerase
MSVANAKLEGSTVLVTGANGFLGRHLISRLAGLGANVHAVSRSVPVQKGQARWYQENVANADAIRALFAQLRPDIVYQLSSAGVGGQNLEYVLATFGNDLQPTVNTLVAAREYGCRRIIITRSLDEPDHSAPSSPYAAAKAASGIYGRMFHELYGLPVVMLRPFMTYGPGQKDHKVIPYAIRSMLNGQAPVLTSGTRLVDWVYVDDVIEAFVAAAVVPDAAGQEIDLGSGSLVSIRDVVERIHDMLPGAPPAQFGSLADRVNERTRQADLSLAQSALGWAPSTPLHDGLSKTIEWYRNRRNSSPVAAAAEAGAGQSKNIEMSFGGN